MSEELKPCPFCGGAMRIDSNRDWHKLAGDHDEDCVFVEEVVLMVPATDDQLATMINDWNRRTADAAELRDSPTISFNKADFDNLAYWMDRSASNGDLPDAVAEEWQKLEPVANRTASTIPASEAGELPPLPLGLGAGMFIHADAVREYGKECARAALASTRTASKQEIVTAGDCMARWLYGLSQSEAMPESWRTTCEELAQAWKGTASDTRTAAGEAECDAALRPAPASQHDAERVAELEAENDQLRDALADKVSAATLLKKFSMEGNALEMTFEGGACHFLADSLGKQFREMKGDNYIEMGFTCSDGLNLLVTMQRTNGKTPAQLKAEAERKLAECEALLAESEATRPRAEGGNTQADRSRVTGNAAEVDVEADRKLAEMRARKDAAYLERNQVVAALAKCFPSGVARTAIEGWSEDWHGCVYIDLPTGQASWHFHDSQAYLFDGLPPYAGKWDGHTTEEKYERISRLAARTQADAGKALYSTRQDAERFRRAIAAEDNAETLYAAVMNNAPDGNAIRAEFDAATTKPENT